PAEVQGALQGGFRSYLFAWIYLALEPDCAWLIFYFVGRLLPRARGECAGRRRPFSPTSLAACAGRERLCPGCPTRLWCGYLPRSRRAARAVFHLHRTADT